MMKLSLELKQANLEKTRESSDVGTTELQREFDWLQQRK
jgi:hypothetical protein